ncbi:Arylacetamide deacetylase-like 2 [Aspergillus hancockii]|nr:Arylacetamide deacetylase-like 2 [Aspergillus hancockii]
MTVSQPSSSTQTPAVDPNLHSFRLQAIIQPLHNSIPAELLPRFDPVYVEHYNKYNAGRLHTHEVPIEEFRKDPAKYLTSYGRATGPDIYRITEQKCLVQGGEIGIRIFEPQQIVDEQGSPKQRGHISTSMEVDGCLEILFAVGYRLVPEHRYPTAVEDSWAAFNWVNHCPSGSIVREKAKEFNIDPDRIAVGGVSAGGHLSAVLAHLCRDANIPLRLQVLAVPACDLHVFTPDGHFDRENCPYESYREMEYTPALLMARMAYFYKHFLGVPRPVKSGEDWKISPMLTSNFSNLAPALVFTAEMDTLRSEGEAYAEKLKAAVGWYLEAGKFFNEKVVMALEKELAA